MAQLELDQRLNGVAAAASEQLTSPVEQPVANYVENPVAPLPVENQEMVVETPQPAANTLEMTQFQAEQPSVPVVPVVPQALSRQEKAMDEAGFAIKQVGDLADLLKKTPFANVSRGETWRKVKGRLVVDRFNSKLA